MKQRTGNPKHVNFCYYGGKGVKVCSEWLKFIPFCEWAFANGFNEENTDLQIDRIDENGDYEPENCQWITRNENMKHMWETRKNEKEE